MTDDRVSRVARSLAGRSLSRRAAVGAGLAGIASAQSLPVFAHRQATPAASPAADPAQAILDIAEEALSEMHLRAVLLHVMVDGEEIAHHATGESMTGIPATPDMHVRNGAVAITYTSTVLLRLVDEGVLALDDTIGQWLPDLADADQVTLRMLANMTSGYPDFVQNADFLRDTLENPFRAWTPEEQIEIGLSTPRVFAPGENWDYSHTNYVILGLALEAATGEPLDGLLKRYILDPLNLTGTAGEQTAWMPEPVLHAFSSERRQHLGIPAGTRFYEESSFWDPSWTLARGSIEYSTIADMTTSFAAIGRGELLSAASYRELVNHDLLGFGAPLEGCPNCFTLDASRLYGLGIWMTGGWLLQNPLFSGYAGTTVYHPDSDIAIGVATTFAEGAFDEKGNYQNASTTIAARIGKRLLPEDPLPGA
jgi:CubicO group peptidase (beta-lactamase class C family)